MKNHNATYCANWKELFSTEKHLETFRGRRQDAFPFVLFITLFFFPFGLFGSVSSYTNAQACRTYVRAKQHHGRLWALFNGAKNTDQIRRGKLSSS
jgi:hypothetical protein